MYKAPTKHGLDRKFKSWRKGKSEHSKNRSSLKKQLRGYERLVSKLQQQQSDDDKNINTTDNDSAIQGLQQKIEAVRKEISHKQQSLQEKKHAEKAHGQRFLDRQRLTRLEKQVRKSKKDKEDQEKTTEQALLKLALDQVYVAHHPMDVKYMPLFKRGQRTVEFSRTLYRRAITRKRILRDLSSSSTNSSQQRVAWIASDQYDRLPNEWSIQDEERVFGGSIGRPNNNRTDKTKTGVEDARFTATSSQHEALLKAADQVEAELLLQENDEEAPVVDESKKTSPPPSKDESSSSSSSDSDSSDDDDDDAAVDPLQAKAVTSSKTATKADAESDSDSSSSSSSDDSSDDEEGDDKDKVTTPTNKRPVDLDSYQVQNNNNNDDDEDDDDFLMDAADGGAGDDITAATNVFESSVVQEVPAWSSVRGDKSKGWQTQMQRPGGDFHRQKQQRKKQRTTAPWR